MLKKLSLPLIFIGLAGWLTAQEPGNVPNSSQDGQQSSSVGSANESGQNEQQQTLAGTISNVDPSTQNVTLRLNDQFGRVLAVNPNTVILRDGKPTQMADLHTGESATVLTDGDTAVRIDVLSQNGGQ